MEIRLKVWNKIAWMRSSRMFSGEGSQSGIWKVEMTLDPRKQYLLWQNGHFYHTRQIRVIFIWALKQKNLALTREHRVRFESRGKTSRLLK